RNPDIAQERAPTGPLRHGEVRTIRPVGRAQWIALTWPPRHGWRVGQARPHRTNFSAMDGRKAWRRGGFLFGDFLLATQEKVTRAPGRRAEKDRDVVVRRTGPALGATRHPLPRGEGTVDSSLRLNDGLKRSSRSPRDRSRPD